MIELLAAVFVAATISVASVSAATLEELDAQLRSIENNVQRSGVAPEAPEPVAPEITIQPRQVCLLKGEEMRNEKASLESLLVTKRKTVEKLGNRTSKMRHTLLLEECKDSDIKELAILKKDIGDITLEEDRQRADVLLDCVNEKIEASEREKQISIERGAEPYEILGFSKRLDLLNKFSREMIDLSIEIGSAANLRDRLEQSSERLDDLCVGIDW